MPSDDQPNGRHRAPGGRANSIGHVALVVLIMGTAFALLIGGWAVVAQLVKPQAVAVVPVIPQESFDPIVPPLASTTPEPTLSFADNKDCGDFFDQEDAQRYYIAQGGPKIDPDKLDLDKDGRACENYVYTSKTPSAESKVRDDNS